MVFREGGYQITNEGSGPVVRRTTTAPAPPPPSLPSSNPVSRLINKKFQPPERSAPVPSPPSPIPAPIEQDESERTYSTARDELRQQQDVLWKNQFQIMAAPEASVFKDASGKTYTRGGAGVLFAPAIAAAKDDLAIIAQRQREGWRARKTDEGLEFYKTGEDIREEGVRAQMEKIRPYYEGSSIVGAAHAVTTSLTLEDPLSIKSTAAWLTGGREGYIRAKAEASYELDRALASGPFSYTLKWLESPVVLIGGSFAFGGGLVAAEARLAGGAAAARLAGTTGARAALAKAGPSLLKAGMVGAGGVMLGLAASDIVSTYERDPWLAVGKAATFTIAAGAVVGGYRAAGGSKRIGASVRAAEDKFYEAHPDRLRLSIGQIGEPVRGGSPSQSISDFVRGRVKLTKSQRTFTKAYVKNPSKFKIQRGLKDILIEETATGKAQKVPSWALEWSEPRADLFTSRGGSRSISRISQKGVRAWKPGKQVVAMSDAALAKAGKRLEAFGIKGTKVRAMELLADEGGVKARPLSDDLSFLSLRGRTGEVGRWPSKRIYDFGIRQVRHARDLSTRERGGGGGLARQRQIAIEDMDFGDVGPAVFASRARSGLGVFVGMASGPAALPELSDVFGKGEVTEPAFSQLQPEVDLDALASLSSIKQFSGQGQALDNLNLPGIDQGRSKAQDQIGDIDLDLGGPTNKKTEDPSARFTSFPFFGVPMFPQDLTLWGFDEDVFRNMFVYGRTRKYRSGDVKLW